MFPTTARETALALYSLNSNEIDDLASMYDFSVTGTVENKKQQVEQYFALNHPNQPKTENGHLMFKTGFSVNITKTIDELTTKELKLLNAEYGLPKLSKSSHSFFAKSKTVLKEHIASQFLQFYPNHPKNDAGQLIFEPEVYSDDE